MPDTTDPSSNRPPLARTILVVEDEPDTRENLEQILEEGGYAVRTAADGQEALDLLESSPPPDLILLDLLMAGMGGEEFRRRQRADPALAGIPVVVLTAAESPGQEETLGDVGYLRKPVDPDELFAVLARFLAPRRPQVLVVEDEPAVLELLKVALRHYGFAVLVANGGREAVELFRLHHAEIDAVLLDVQMPDVDGPQTFAALREISPAVPCVFMSGNTGKYTAEQLLTLGAFRVLSKPFSSLDGVMRVLREATRA